VGSYRGILFQGVGENMAQHRTDDKKYIYKLEIYQKTFLDFVCGSPTSTEASC
jgi:hypothetical protein